MTNLISKPLEKNLILEIFVSAQNAVRKLFVGENRFEITRSCTTVDDYVVVTFGHSRDCKLKQFVCFLRVSFGSVKGTKFLLFQTVVEFIHQILELLVGFTFVRNDEILELHGVTNFTFV